MKKICLVTEELAGIQGSGGIGAAFLELGALLAANKYQVDILYCPVDPIDEDMQKKLQQTYIKLRIKLDFLDVKRFADGAPVYEKKSYAVYETLKSSNYDFIHFHDYKGLGFFSINAKNQGISFQSCQLVLQMHGPTRWAVEANSGFFVHEDQLKIDFMERECAKKADWIVSPSQYLVDWLKANGFLTTKKMSNVFVIKNAFGLLQEKCGNNGGKKLHSITRVDEIIFFGRHEDRKGINIFCEALDLVKKHLENNDVKVTFLGKFGKINSQDSGVYLVDKGKNWGFPVSLIHNLDRDGAAQYLRNSEGSVVVVGSPYENSPYTVLETLLLNRPIICSEKGGGPEIIKSEHRGHSLIRMEKEVLGKKLVDVIHNGAKVSDLNSSSDQVAAAWIEFHEKKYGVDRRQGARSLKSSGESLPKVVFGITHFERPGKLIDAITSAIRQTYKNIEIVVVDDGSERPETLEALEAIEIMLERVGGRLIRQRNGYLGAARNTIIKNTDSEYLVFLDDDDIAMPTLVEKLVCAIQSSGADVVNCINLYINEAERKFGMTHPENFKAKPSYVPIGGPMSVAPVENVLGAATAIFKRDSLNAIGGYTELRGIGHEDYELFLKFVQAGYKLEICPIPLYLYEVGRVGMLLKTSHQENFRRCFDAIQFDKNSNAWRDNVNLSVGKRVAIDAHNKTHWMNSQQNNGALRNKLLTENYSSAMDRIKDLLQLSKQESSHVFVAAFEEILQHTNDKVDNEESVSVFAKLSSRRADSKLAGLSKAAQDLSPDVLKIKYEMALSRSHDALSLILQRLETLARIQEIDVYLIRELLVGSLMELDGAMLKRIAELLVSKQMVPSIPEGVARDILILINLALSDFESLLYSLKELVDQDESEYLESNVDVRKAVQLKEIPSGLFHYINHGAAESWRSGFQRLSKAAELMSSAGGLNLGIHNVVEYVELMAAGAKK